MSSKDSGYDIIFLGAELKAEYIKPGRWVFFQRLKEYGGGFWFGRTYPDYYEFGLPYPVSLKVGIDHLLLVDRVEGHYGYFDDDFKLK